MLRENTARSIVAQKRRKRRCHEELREKQCRAKSARDAENNGQRQFREDHAGQFWQDSQASSASWARSLPRSGLLPRPEKSGTDTFFLKEGQNIFCPCLDSIR